VTAAGLCLLRATAERVRAEDSDEAGGAEADRDEAGRSKKSTVDS